MKPGLRLFHHSLLALAAVIACGLVSTDAFAVCSMDDRHAMAAQGMDDDEINRECAGRGPITGMVCSTNHRKCRLSSPQEFSSDCTCTDSYGREDPGKVQQY